MKKFAAFIFVIAILASIATVSFAETAAGPKSVEIEEYSDFFLYSLAASSLTAEYGVGDDAIALDDAGEDISEYATRRIMVRTEGELHDWDGIMGPLSRPLTKKSS